MQAETSHCFSSDSFSSLSLTCDMTPNRLTEEVDDYYHAGSLAPRSEEEQPRHSGVNKLKKARWGINFGAVTCVVGAVVAWTQREPL